MSLPAPEPLTEHHRLDAFSSGNVSLDAWLKRRALDQQASGASRSFVACEGSRVVGCYALAPGKIVTLAAPGFFRRLTPEPIPVVVLSRLGVDRAHKRRGLGRALFRDAARRVMQAADALGIGAILASATSEEARAFAAALGFEPSPIEPMTLMVRLGDLAAVEAA